MPRVGFQIIGTIKEVKGFCNKGHKVGDKIELDCHDSGGLCGIGEPPNPNETELVIKINIRILPKRQSPNIIFILDDIDVNPYDINNSKLKNNN